MTRLPWFESFNRVDIAEFLLDYLISTKFRVFQYHQKLSFRLDPQKYGMGHKEIMRSPRTSALRLSRNHNPTQNGQDDDLQTARTWNYYNWENKECRRWTGRLEDPSVPTLAE